MTTRNKQFSPVLSSPVFCALVLFSCAQSLEAQDPTVEKHASWERKFGGDYGYGKAEARAEIRRIDQRLFDVKWVGGWPIRVERRDAFDYNARLRGSVGLFGRSATLGYASADLYVKQGYYSRNPELYKTGTPSSNRLYARLYARVFGNTVVNETRHYTSTIYGFNREYSGFSVSKDFWVGPVPVTVRGRLAGGCAVSGSVVLDPDYANPRIGIAGNASGYASASASAGVGITGASVGVSTRLKLLNTRADLEAAASRSGIGGDMRISVQPLILKLYIYVEALWWRYTKTIWGWETASWSKLYEMF